MWIRSRSGPAALFVPVILLAFTGALATFSVTTLIRAPSLGAAFGALVGVSFFALMLADVTLARVVGARFIVRTPFARHELEARSLAVSMTRQSSSRGGLRYETIAADASGARAKLGETWTERGGQRATEKLRELFEGFDDSTARRRVRAELDREKAVVDSQFAAAQAQVDAYYASPKHKRTIILLMTGVALYVIGMSLYIFLQGE